MRVDRHRAVAAHLSEAAQPRGYQRRAACERFQRRAAERLGRLGERHSDRGLLPRRLDLGIGKAQVDRHPAAGPFGGGAERPDRLRLPVGGRQDEAGAPAGARFQHAGDRAHRLAMALVVEPAADRKNRLVLRAGARPVGHVEAVGNGAHRRTRIRIIGAETGEAVLADEGETREALQEEIPLGPLHRARRRLLVGVAMQDDGEPGRRGDERRRWQVILDDRDIDAAALQKLADRPGLGEIAAEGDVRDRIDGDARERLVHLGAHDQGRARIAATADEVAHAELDRRRALRPEHRIPQQDVGDFRLTRHQRTRNSWRSNAPPRRSLHARVRRDKSPEWAIAARGEFCLNGRPNSGPVDKSAQANA